MYGHPQTPDPYSERQEIPPYVEPEAPTDPTGFTAACLVIALPVFSIAFCLGYMSGVWGWL